jgi:hypothetical protein
MASVTRKRLVAGSQLTTSAATYYTAPAGTRTQITAMTLTNTTGGAITATVNLGTSAAANTVLSARSLSAGESYSVTGAIGQVMEAGEVLQALASANASISLVVSGIEFV